MEDRLNPCNYNLLRAAAAVRIQPRRSFQISRLSSSVGIHCELLGRAIGCDHPIPFHPFSLLSLEGQDFSLLFGLRPLLCKAGADRPPSRLRRNCHVPLQGKKGKGLCVAGLVLLLNVAIILYPPWLSGYISLIQYRYKASMATDALTSLHEFVWLYPIPLISFAYVWQSTKPIAKQKLQSLEYNYGPLG